jgi:hypothetical protein
MFQKPEERQTEAVTTVNPTMTPTIPMILIRRRLERFKKMCSRRRQSAQTKSRRMIWRELTFAATRLIKLLYTAHGPGWSERTGRTMCKSGLIFLGVICFPTVRTLRLQPTFSIEVFYHFVVSHAPYFAARSPLPEKGLSRARLSADGRHGAQRLVEITKLMLLRFQTQGFQE